MLGSGRPVGWPKLVETVGFVDPTIRLSALHAYNSPVPCDQPQETERLKPLQVGSRRFYIGLFHWLDTRLVLLFSSTGV